MKISRLIIVVVQVGGEIICSSSKTGWNSV
jgi:hypothetical protein